MPVDESTSNTMPKPSQKWSEARRKAQATLEAMTDEEDAAITADALADADNPPADALLRHRGHPASDNPKAAGQK